MDVRDAVRDVEKRLHEARKAAELIPELEAQLRGLRSYLSSLDPSFDGQDVLALDENHDDDAEPDEEDEWVSMTRPQAILTVLAEASRSMSPSQIAEHLTEAGRENDNSHNVGIALGRLKKKGLVRSRGYGKWGLARSS